MCDKSFFLINAKVCINERSMSYKSIIYLFKSFIVKSGFQVTKRRHMHDYRILCSAVPKGLVRINYLT